MAASSNSTALTDDNRISAVSLLHKIKSMNELLFMAGEGMVLMSRDTANAITQGCDVVDDFVSQALNLLEGGGSAGENVE